MVVLKVLVFKYLSSNYRSTSVVFVPQYASLFMKQYVREIYRYQNELSSGFVFCVHVSTIIGKYYLCSFHHTAGGKLKWKNLRWLEIRGSIRAIRVFGSQLGFRPRMSQLISLQKHE